jgi:prepilin-type processing-associated H-X9-DG protein
MKPRLSNKRNAAMTLFEVGVVIAIVMILVAVFLPKLARPHVNHARINCVNNLKQIGLAYRIWEGDNGDKYPMGISVTNGGSMETVATGDVVQSFLVMSNELSTPKILICREDTARIMAPSFAGLANSNISYFVGVDVTNDAANPQMIISGDCNFQIGGVPVKPGLRQFWTNDPVAWMATRHVNAGNIGLADGSVQLTTSLKLRDFLQQTGLVTNRFAIP